MSNVCCSPPLLLLTGTLSCFVYCRTNDETSVFIGDVQLLLPQAEWDFVANTARGANSFVVQLAGESAADKQAIRLALECVAWCCAGCCFVCLSLMLSGFEFCQGLVAVVLRMLCYQTC
jgi:hypothetical protein